ncbi:DUF6226 family protein [Agromyces indicus]|uniref:DUF6226 family protein n=1 Tax=Agromyces indicus TaxID=758919 RepID=A0ABU1FG69_9MICO|nr:DUF6226 family protein [Agromyces indicus]MDR5690441.1 DUF6226 family protein [Agromyces indicus]
MGYERPELPVGVYVDEDGTPIEYGNRWGPNGPPEGAYSRTSNLDRFAGLHAVAHALIEWLASTFDVEVETGSQVAADLLLQPDDPIHSVRLTPRSTASAPLTFVLTSFPGVYLHAGVLHDFHFPVCGCDACDDDVRSLADDLEWTVRMVVTGHYRESVNPQGSEWLGYRLEEPGVRTATGQSRTDEVPIERSERARHLVPGAGPWEPWPARPRSAGG